MKVAQAADPEERLMAGEPWSWHVADLIMAGHVPFGLARLAGDAELEVEVTDVEGEAEPAEVMDDQSGEDD